MPSLDERVLELFALVMDGFVGAKEAFLHGDSSIVTQLIERERRIDRLYHRLQEEVSDLLTQPDANPQSVHYLVSIIRIIPELERSGDLALHIAQKAVIDPGGDLSPRTRGILEQMAEVATALWNATAIAYEERDPSAAERLQTLDEDLDELHASFRTEVAATCTSISTAMEMALVGRFFERFGDHAVNVARTIADMSSSPTLR